MAVFCWEADSSRLQSPVIYMYFKGCLLTPVIYMYLKGCLLTVKIVKPDVFPGPGPHFGEQTRALTDKQIVWQPNFNDIFFNLEA